MIPEQETLILSPYIEIYDLVVPKDNILRQMNDLVDFTFILEELKSKYCLNNGRMAYSPIQMFKYLLLKSIFDLSDVDVVERSKYDMSFKYFLDMAPEDEVIHPSSLTKFRKLRLKDMDLLNLLVHKTVEIALEKGIIQSKTIIIDSTHTKSRYNQKSIKEFLQEKSKNVRKAIYQIDESFSSKFPDKSKSDEVEDELNYCRQLINIVESESHITDIPSVNERLNVLKEVVDDCDEQICFSNDPDARVGHKSTESSFFGYKTHLAMSDERLITAAVITTGEQSDGKYLQELVEKSEQAGMKVETIIGDTAYSSKDNIVYSNENNIELVSKLHPHVTGGTRKEEDTFEYNKDAEMYVCKAGHLAIKKKHDRGNKKDKNERIRYMFDIEKCKICPLRKGCYKDGAKSKSYYVTIKSPEHQGQALFQETEAFKYLAKKRYKIEAKNSELKHRHGYDVSISSGLFGLNIQSATTIFAVNLKRIIKLMNQK